MSGIPQTFIRPNGELFCGGYLNKTELHFPDGWREEIIPTEFDPETHCLGEVYYDTENDIVTYVIEQVVLPVYTLTELQDIRKSELSAVMDEFVVMITRSKLLYGENNTDLNSAIQDTLAMHSNTIAAIDAFEDVNLLKDFKIKQTDVNYYKSLFKPFKH